MNGPSSLRRRLTLIGLFFGILAASVLWVQWPEVALAVRERRVDTGLVWLIALNAGPILILVISLWLIRRYFHITGPRRAAKTRHLIEALKKDGQSVRLCDTCGGTGRHGSSAFFLLGRTILARSACKECRGTGMMRDCQTCGYNLTGNVSGVCAECGEACKRDASAT